MAAITKQKTWRELLGTNTTNCVVDGCYISRKVGPDHYFLVWAFDTPDQAAAAFRTWIQETSN